MANVTNTKYLNIARPYALAAFEYARDQHQLPAWKFFLESAASVAKDASVVNVLGSPVVSKEKLFELFNDILGSQLDTSRKNFLLLLAENHRLNTLPEIADVFNDLYTSLEKTSTVRVVTAVDVSKDFQHKLAQALSKRINHEVTLKCEVNPSIIGGAIIHIGDKVIDGSISGKLTRLYQSLTD